MPRREIALISVYAALAVGCANIEWFLTEGDEPALIASAPFALFAAITLGAGITWGRWRALWIIPTVAVVMVALFLLVTSGSWWLRDNGDRGYAGFVLAAIWFLVAPFAFVGVSLRQLPRWWRQLTRSS